MSVPSVERKIQESASRLARPEGRKRGSRLWLLLVPALALLLAVFIVPLVQILHLSFTGDGFTTGHYVVALTDDILVRVLLRTLWVSISVTFGCLLLGYPVAYLMLRSSEAARHLIALLIVLPLWTSILVRTYAWIVILGRQGMANNMLLALGLTDQPVTLLYNRFSVLLGMIHIMLPFMVLPLYAVMQQIDLRLLSAASSMGAGRLSSFLLVFLPLSLPGVLAGSLLVFILSIGFFVTPALLGGLGETTYVMLIEQQINRLLNWPLASAMSVVLLLATLTLVFLYNRILSSGSATTASIGRLLVRFMRVTYPLSIRASRMAARLRILGGRFGSSARTTAPKERHFLVRVTGSTIVVFMVAPIVIIVPLAFSAAPYLEFPPPAYSLRWFENYFARPDWVQPTVTSFQVAALTTVFGTAIGTMAAIAMVRGVFPGKKAILALLLAPIIVPTIIVAIAIYALFARLGLIGTRTGLVVAHLMLAVPYVIVVVSAALERVDQSLEQAAWTLGASKLAAFRRITLPLIQPAIFTAALFAFLASFDEVVVAIFISGTTATTLPKRMWDGIREEIDPTIAAVATLLVCLSLLLMFVTEILRRQGRRKGAPPTQVFIK